MGTCFSGIVAARGAQLAMQILVDFCKLTGVSELLDVSQAHIDATIHIGSAYLQVVQKFMALGARFVIPTTLNSLSLDYRRWKELGMAEDKALPAKALADAYMEMGATMSFTCAPYLLDSAPTQGQQIGWSESNAVVFANSVLGARTQKYPDLLDVCIALTGRAPASGCHLDRHRQPRIVIRVCPLKSLDDAAWPLIGYATGHLAGPYIPLILGLEKTTPRTSDLKAFSAAFATTASAPMYHMNAITPEAKEPHFNISGLPLYDLTRQYLAEVYRLLNTAKDETVGLITLGNPHFALEEFEELSTILSTCLKGQPLKIKMIITTSRDVQQKAEDAGYLKTLFKYGADVVTDTCWCMIEEPIIPISTRNLMTNSAKYAHYAPALVRRGVHFGSLAQCVDAAITGMHTRSYPLWLFEQEERKSS